MRKLVRRSRKTRPRFCLPSLSALSLGNEITAEAIFRPSLSRLPLMILLSALWMTAPYAFAHVQMAEVQIPAESAMDSEVLQQVLQHGERLEAERRWGEALQHYEEATRTYPDQPKLRERLTLTRARYDLVRRYRDGTFVKSLSDLTEKQTLDVYSEVLLKIQTHHVDSPSWKELLRRGTMQLDVALSDESFRKRHMPLTETEEIDRYMDHIYDQLKDRPVPNRYDATNVVGWAGRLAAQHLGLPAQAVVQEFIAGAITSLDNYAAYLTAAQLDDVFSQIDGNFVGLGIELKSDDAALLIVSVIPGGPAEEAGLVAGDRIVEVNGQTTRDLSTEEAADLLKGEQDSTAILAVERESGETQMVHVTRRRVEVPSVVDVKMIDRDYGIGYLRITSFQKTTSRDVDAALWKLHREGMKKLIIDVRDNPGGLLNASVEVADKFLDSGSIVSTRGRSSRENHDHTAHQAGTWRTPLVVLIDNNSASAAEIFAGAIGDQRRGTLVGTRTYGKGSVQGIFPLKHGAGVRMTTARFYSPSGKSISERGVVPDRSVHVTAKPIDEGDQVFVNKHDEVLETGLQVAREQLTQR